MAVKDLGSGIKALLSQRAGVKCLLHPSPAVALRQIEKSFRAVGLTESLVVGKLK